MTWGVDVFARADSVTGTEFSSRHGQWEKALDTIEANLSASRHKGKNKWLRVLSYRRAILAAAYRREGRSDYADELMKKALANPLLNALQRFYIKFSYRFTAAGGRGTAVLANLIL